jgi:hypothetical protein
MRRALLGLALALSAGAAPMDAPTTAAANRLIDAAKRHPLAIVIDNDTIARAEAEIRAAMVSGLSAEQAADLSKALDTPAERAEVSGVLRTLGSDADVVAVLRWVLYEVRTAQQVVPVQPGVTFEQRLQRQCLFVSAPNYHWPQVPVAEIGPWMDRVRAAGLDGVSLEFFASPVADEYRGSKLPGQDPRAVFTERVQQFAPWHAAAKARGLGMHVSFLNSNWTPIRNASPAQWRDMARQWAERYPDGCIVLPVSERDGRASGDRVRAVLDGFGGYAKARLVRYSDEGSGDFNEFHNGNVTSLRRGDRRILNVSDNGSILRQLFADFPQDGRQVREDNLRLYVSGIRRAGTSGVVYSFDRTLPGYLDVVGAAWGAAGQPDPLPNDTRDAIPASAVRVIGKHRMDPAKARITSTMRSASISSGLVRVSHEPLDGWPVGQKEAGCDSGFVIVWRDGGGYVGGFFDHGRVGQTVKTLKNIPGGYVDGKQPPKGGPVWFYKISTDGKSRTTICPGGVWP